MIREAKENYLPNGVRDTDKEKVSIWRYLNNAETIMGEIKNFNMANVVIRSSFKVPVAENMLIKLLNFYTNLETTNPDLYNEIITIKEELTLLYDNMRRYKKELGLL